MDATSDKLINSVRGLVQKNKELQDQLAEAKKQLTNYQSKKSHNHLLVAMRLRKLGLRYRNFKNIFKIGTTVLSGGFVLQTILGEYWQTDLDIFTNDADKVIEELNNQCEWISQPRLVDRKTVGSYESYPPLQVIERVYRGEIIKGVYIEIIESRDPIQNIKNFDFDFCKCYYNGANFHVLNTQAIVTKSCSLPQNKVYQHRVDKYQLRGFTINVVRDANAEIEECLSVD